MKQLVAVSQINQKTPDIMFYTTVYWKIYFQKLAVIFQFPTSFTSGLVPVNTNLTDVFP